MQNGLKQGFGKFYYLNGNKYKGEWKENKKNGRGIYKYRTTGEIYNGEWKVNIKVFSKIRTGNVKDSECMNSNLVTVMKDFEKKAKRKVKNY